jgi:hypothetical protein
MKRFLTLLAVAAIAGAMYVAAAPGGLRSAGPTAKQFKALKASVTKLQKQVKAVDKLALAEAGLLLNCLAFHAQGVDRFGAVSGTGYEFGSPGVVANQTTTALDLAPSSETSSQFYFLAVNPSCAGDINSSGGATAAAQAVGALQRMSAQMGH